MAKSKRLSQNDHQSSRSNSKSQNSIHHEGNRKMQFNITVYRQSNGTYSLSPAVVRYPMQMSTNVNPLKIALPFKKKNWVSKLRAQDKAFRNAKNMKSLSKDIIDGISYKIYQDLEAGPSILPKRKFCDYTGFETNYTEINTGIRFYNSQIYRLFQNMSQPVKDQYLNIRKALIRLK